MLPSLGPSGLGWLQPCILGPSDTGNWGSGGSGSSRSLAAIPWSPRARAPESRQSLPPPGNPRLLALRLVGAIVLAPQHSPMPIPVSGTPPPNRPLLLSVVLFPTEARRPGLPKPVNPCSRNVRAPSGPWDPESRTCELDRKELVPRNGTLTVPVARIVSNAETESDSEAGEQWA